MGQHLADLVLRWEAERPDHQALRYGDRCWTWAQWAGRIRRNAAAQRALGLRAGDRVATLDKNHPAGLETTLGCAMAGTVNASLNFRLAPEEYVYLLNSSGARLLLVGVEFAPMIESVRDRLTHLEHVVVVGSGADDDEYERWLASASPDVAPVAAAPDEVVLQLYTSGTTGRPKGAMLTHRGLLAHSAAAAEAFRIGPSSVAQVAMPLYHVGGTSWALIVVYVGGTIVLDREVVPDAVLDELAGGVTHTFLVPAVLAVLLGMPGAREMDFSSVEVISYGASPIPPKVLAGCLDVFGANFLGLYGMTEASGIVTALPPEAHRDASHPERLLSVGLPMPGVEVRVVSPTSGRDVGVDEVGEVWARSAQLMLGYYNRPEETADAFAEGGWYRTGDAARLDSAGYLYLTDRIKDLIISGGENVYPAEVERVLSEHPSVAEVAVIGMPSDRWGEVPLAYVVAAPGARVDEAELIAYSRDHLAKYKCPAAVRALDALPRNPTGKILKTELRKLA